MNRTEKQRELSTADNGIVNARYWKAIVLLALSACMLVHESAFALNSNVSGAWYDPAYDGSGFLVEVLADERAVVYWFTYDEAGAQQWYIGVGTTDDSGIVVDELMAATGGQFGPEFDPLDIMLTDAGSLSIDFNSCESGRVTYLVEGQTGEQILSRLTSIDGNNCSESTGHQELNQSSSWFNTSRSGEGFVVQVLNSESAFVTFFSFDAVGNPAWFTGLASVASQSLVIDDLITTSGGRFGPEHDPQAVVRDSVGRLELYLGCQEGRVNYDMNQPRPSGSHELVRLTSLADVECKEDQFSPASVNELYGIWYSSGFGTAAQITPQQVRLFETTALSCLPVFEAPGTVLSDLLELFSLNQDADRLQFVGLDAVTPVFFTRVEALPDSCSLGLTSFTPDPMINFEIFSSTYDERYAAFEQRQLDWATQVDNFRSNVLVTTPPHRLLEVFAQMLQPLLDLHTTIETESQFYSSGFTPERAAYYNRAQGSEVDQIVSGYLSTERFLAAANTIEFGLLSGNIGYMEVKSFSVNEGGNTRDERLEYYRQELDRVLNYYLNQGVEQLIVDVRRNGGGDSGFSFELASRFLRGQTRTLFTERRPTGSGSLSQPYVQQLAPTQRRQFDGDTVLLTGRITGSAAEIFVLAMRATQHVFTVGEPTAGILSRTGRVLPNGWLVSLTGGLIRTPEGDLFEAMGIPAHTSVPVFSEQDYNDSRDSALERAISYFSDQ